MKDLSVVFVSYNTKDMTREALNVLNDSKTAYSYELLMVDNASRDGSADMIASEFPEVYLIRNDFNVGFGRANNQLLDQIKGRYVLLLNTDAFVAADTLQKTVNFMETHPETGILGVRLEGRDTVLQPSCRYFPTPWNLFLVRTGLKRIFRGARLVDDMAWDHQSVRHCDWVPGCYYLIRREVIEKVGLFDPRFFLYYEEVDHCLATKRAGWQVTYCPDTTVLHIGGESAKTDNVLNAASRQVSALQIESELLYFRKNHGLFGLLQLCFLTLLAELIMFVKRAVKTRFNLNAMFNFHPFFLFCKLLKQTSFGRKPIH